MRFEATEAQLTAISGQQREKESIHPEGDNERTASDTLQCEQAIISAAFCKYNNGCVISQSRQFSLPESAFDSAAMARHNNH